LDAAERQRIEQQLLVDPALRAELEELRRLIEPVNAELESLLHTDDEQWMPPSDLVARTMAGIPFVGSADGAGQRLRGVRPEPTVTAGRRTTLADAVMVLAASMAVISLGLPLTLQVRHSAQRASCAENLAELGRGAAGYAMQQPDGRFPLIPTSGPLSFAGNAVVELHRTQWLDDEHVVWCRSSDRPESDWKMPSREELQSASPDLLDELQLTAGGSYSYCLGVADARGRHVAPKVQGRVWFALASDEPLGFRQGGRPPHDGQGINILFEDGRVQFVRVDALIETRLDPFLNNLGNPESGVTESDSALGPSWMPPFQRD
jgi:hypothetical protein